MKKLFTIFTMLFLGAFLFAETYAVKVTGKAYVILSETEREPLQEEDKVSEDDIIQLSEGSTITFIINGKKKTVKRVGEFKVFDKIKDLK